MAYIKLGTLLAVFLFATFVTFPMENVEAGCSGVCSPFEKPLVCGSRDCRCIPWGLFVGQCIHHTGSELVMKMAEDHTNLCKSHVDCIKKGSGSFCARYPNLDIEYGWCFVSNSEAERLFEIGLNSAVQDILNIGCNSKPTDCLKTAIEMAT